MNILIVEDEVSVALQLIKRLKQCTNFDINSIKHLEFFDDAEEYLREHCIDVLFLDLNLNGHDGFDILKNALAKSFQTIVVSANTDRAIDAFEIGVLDFVAKPFSAERIQKAVNRLTEQQRDDRVKSRYLSIKTAGKIELIALSEVITISADGNYSKLVLDSGRELLHDKTLEKLLKVLPNYFERIHRSHIVPMNKVRSLVKKTGSQYFLLLQNGIKLPLGRTHYPRIKSLLE